MSDPAEILQSTQTETAKKNILRNVYLWMLVGLGITAVVAYAVSLNFIALFQAIGSTGFIVLLVAQLGLVFYINVAMKRLGVLAASLLFALFALLNGISLSFIFIAYDIGYIAQTFVATAAMFGGAAFFGMFTKRNLSGWGQFLSLAVIGLLVASLLGLLLSSPMLDILISLAGVVIFAGLTAYHNQRILNVSNYYGDSIDEVNYVRVSILGALSLYLSFINMFLFMLRLFGGRR